MATTSLVPQQRGDLAAADIMADFGRFLRLHTADGDASPATIRSYYGNAAQFVAWCGEHGINPATATEDDIAA
jgi:site-specific recombinase XerD